MANALREYIKKQPGKFKMVEHSLNYLNNFSDKNKLSDQKLKENIKKAENFIKDGAHPEFISSFLLHEIHYHFPEKKTEIEQIVGKSNIKIILSLNLIKKHFAQKDKSENTHYFEHSLQTAKLLSKMNMDEKTIAAGLLHHCLHIYENSYSGIEKNLDNKIIKIIKNYHKINHFTNKTKSLNHKAREILLVMAEDVRVIFIKMASTIDSLKNYERLPENDRYLVAKQAKDILAPLADMLGMWHYRWQLEDRAFEILQPNEYEKIDRRFGKEGKKNRERYINKLKKILEKEAKEKNIHCEINGRFKHYYSIYRKMKIKQKTFNEIHDVFALRVLVKTIDECYLMLRLIHKLWPPIHKRIKDYIAAPKDNGYQAIHTTVIGPGNRHTEFQIRTFKMHEKALFGVASQSIYKYQEMDNEWIRKILRTGRLFPQKKSWEEEVNKIFQEKIYVYSPKGDVISLPKGSTPVDFAYKIHTELGHYCKFAIVNNQPAELNKQLKNEDVVEIIPDINSKGPDPEWLNFIKSNQARKEVKKFLKSKGLL